MDKRSLALGLLVPTLFWAGCSKDSSDSNDAPAPAEVPTGPDLGLKDAPGFVLDDFKSCSTEFKTAVDTYWFFFTDVADGGLSTSKLELGEPIKDGGACSLKWSGRVTTDYEYGYAGIGVDLGTTALTSYKSLVFQVRGDGAAYRVKLPMNTQLAGNEYNFFGADINCGDGTANWKTVTIDLNAVQQEQGWGKTVALNLADVGKIQIQTKGQPIPAFACEIGTLSLVK